MKDVESLFDQWCHTNGITEDEKTLPHEAFIAGYLACLLVTAVDVTPDTPFNPLDHEQTR